MSLRRSQAARERPQAAPDETRRKSALPAIWARHKESVLWCALLLVCLFVVRLVFLEAPCHRGDTNYMVIADNYSAELLKDAPDQIYYRTGMILPLVFLENLCGYNLTTYYVFSLSLYALVVVGVFLVSRSVGDLTTAVIATSLAGTSALFLSRSSNAFPDTPNLAFMLFSFALFVRAIRGKTSGTPAVVAAALCAFAAYLFRAPNLLWLICIPIYEVLQNRSFKKTLLFAAVFAGLLVVECVYYLVFIGDPLARFRMVFGAVGAWSGNMPYISVRQYLFEPFTEILESATGWILLFGAAAGLVTAIRRRHWPLVSLMVGGVLLFAVYSYAVSSTDPLRRAAPLQHRYIMAFTAVLAITTGFALAQLRRWIEARGNGPVLRTCALLVMGGLLVCQLWDLPDTIGRQARFLGKDSFFFADQVLQAKADAELGNTTVYAAPIRPFTLYRNFRDLQLEEMQLFKPPKQGQTLLYSRRYLHRQLAIATLPHRTKNPAWQKRAKWLDYYLQYPPPPDWQYIVNTGDIVLVRVGNPNAPTDVALDLTAPIFCESAWAATGVNGTPTPATIRHDDDSLVFSVPAAHKGPAFFYTFPGPWNTPAKGWTTAFTRLVRKPSVTCKLGYSLSHNATALSLTLIEYDANRQLGSTTHHLPRRHGARRLSKEFVLNDETVSIRVVMKLVTSHDIEMKLDQFRLCAPTPAESQLAETAVAPAGGNTSTAREELAQQPDANKRR